MRNAITLTLNPRLLFRVPQFPIDARLIDHWPALQASIKLSSPEFYKVIEKIAAEDIEALPQRIQDTIHKYFNRARFRATPYGSFAAVGLGYLHHQAGQKGITIHKEQQLYGFVDWKNIDEISVSPEDIINEDLCLISNNSYYPVKKSLRYISHFEGCFQLSDILTDTATVAILQLCLAPIRYSDLLKSVQKANIGVENLKGLVAQLIDLQLLFTSKHPNIIGADYFNRIGFQQQPGKPSYVIAKRKVSSGALDTGMFRQLPEMVHHLHQLLPPQEDTSLQRFIERFNQKFGMSEIPLLQCLDPETGIGYDDLEHLAGSEELINRFAGNRDLQATDRKTFLEKSIGSQLHQWEPVKQPVIHLEHIQTEEQENTLPLPNSLSILLSITQEGMVMESLGGCTANALLGRFSLGNQDITRYCSEIAAAEQNANFEILFFDIAYMAENGVDNVNRRAAIYPYQLSLLNYDTSADPLCLNDIYVSIRGHEVVLRSRKLNKRLVPRIASAYNYNRSDLAVFRLLCDLQHQGIQSNLQFNLQDLFPHARYYPRVQYKQYILSPAKWKIEAKEIQAGNNAAELAACLKNMGIGRYAKTGVSDQTLFLDTQNESDLNLLLRLMQNKDTFYLEEAFLPSIDIIKDEDGHSYQNQILLCLGHDREIYKGYSIKEQINPGSVSKIIPPGEDWLYFELYCHAYRSDEILAEQITDYLGQYRPLIKKWFFIRYSENGNHIRLRLLLHDPAEAMQLIAALSNLLKGNLESGIISDVQLKTYHRETERYSLAGMEAVESHFYSDSEYVLNLVQAMFSDQDKYHLCARLIEEIRQSGIFPTDQFTGLIRHNSMGYNREHQIKTEDFKELNAAYKVYRQHSAPELTAAVANTFSHFSASFIRTLEQCPIERKEQLFSDLLHMHVNRLFSSNQRTHEMILYYFLDKECQYKKHFGKANSNCK
nr:lantibiotic dehydratase [Pedobacter sp. ASV19]